MRGLLRRLFQRAAISLSTAGSRDTAAIAALHAASFHRGWDHHEIEGLLADRSVVADCAMRRTALVGFILSRCAADEAEILSVAVSAACQGRGIAHDLLVLHLRRLSGRGVRSVFLEVSAVNVSALRLYHRAGFREVARRANYYPAADGTRAHALVLRRDFD